jgi:signal transduction histidine kinase
MKSSTSLGRLGVACAAFLGVFYAVTNLAPDGVATTFDDLAQLAAPCLAGAACLIAARRRSERRAWTFMAVSAFAWAAGQAVWVTYEVILGREVPGVSPADVGFLAAIPFAWAALLSFPSTKTSSRGRAVLDGLIVAGAGLYLAWSGLLGPLVRSTPLGSFAAIVDVAYPVGDLVTLVLVVLAIVQARPERRRSFGFVTAGLALMAAADSAFLVLELHNVYSTGSFVDGLWVASFLLIGLGAVDAASRRAADAETPKPQQRRDALLYVPVALSLIAATAIELGGGGIEAFLVWLGIAIFCAVLAQQYLTIRDNRRLNGMLATQLADVEKVRVLQDAFVANVSHELRTPVTTLMGAARTLLRPEMRLGAQQRLLVEALDRASSRMSQMVEDLIIAAGLNEKIALARSPLDLNATVRQAAAKFAPSNKTVELRLGAALTAIGDAEWLEEIVMQLLTNADRFAPDGTTITIETEMTGETACIVVRDEGPGIDEADRPKLFKRFTRLDTSNAKHAGVGLGLYICRRLAESMGATIALDESPGAGVAFRVALPALPASALPAANEAV